MGQRQGAAQLITGKVLEAHYGSILTLLRMMIVMMVMMMMVMMIMIIIIIIHHYDCILTAHNENYDNCDKETKDILAYQSFGLFQKLHQHPVVPVV